MTLVKSGTFVHNILLEGPPEGTDPQKVLVFYGDVASVKAFTDNFLHAFPEFAGE